VKVKLFCLICLLLWISLNVKKYYVYCIIVKAPHGSFYEDEWFLYSNIFAYFISFEFNFIDMTLDNYGWVETANSKTLLFMVSSSTILIKHEIFNPEKWETTKQILQSELRVESNENSFTFCNKSSDAVLLATSSFWGNIQIIRTCILKYNVLNFMSFTTRHLDFEILYHHL